MSCGGSGACWPAKAKTESKDTAATDLSGFIFTLPSVPGLSRPSRSMSTAATVIACRVRKVEQFISEDDLQTFEGWLRYQCIDPKTTSTEELESWHQLFED